MRNQVDGTVAVLYLDEARTELSRYMPVAPTEDTTAGETALILYTSGTTKDPKGVVHTHAYTWAQRMQASHWLDAHEHDVVWCTAGTGWAKAIWNVLLGPWSHGAEVVVHEGAFDPEERLALLQKLGVTVLCQAPTEYRMLAKLDRLAGAHLPRLRHAVSAGEPLNPEVIERFQDALGLTIYDGYGQTENSLLVANTTETPGPTGLDGPSDTGPRRRGDRRRGPRLRRGRGGRSRADRSPADALHRVLGSARRHGRGVPRRLVRDGRPCRARRGGLSLVRRTRGRRDPLRCLPHRPVRGRERAPRASGGRRERCRRRARPGSWPARQGVRRPPPGARAGRRAGGRAAGARQGRDGAVQVSARDLVRGRAAEDLERQDPPRRAAGESRHRVARRPDRARDALASPKPGRGQRGAGGGPGVDGGRAALATRRPRQSRRRLEAELAARREAEAIAAEHARAAAEEAAHQRPRSSCATRPRRPPGATPRRPVPRWRRTRLPPRSRGARAAAAAEAARREAEERERAEAAERARARGRGGTSRAGRKPRKPKPSTARAEAEESRAPRSRGSAGPRRSRGEPRARSRRSAGPRRSRGSRTPRGRGSTGPRRSRRSRSAAKPRKHRPAPKPKKPRDAKPRKHRPAPKPKKPRDAKPKKRRPAPKPKKPRGAKPSASREAERARAETRPRPPRSGGAGARPSRSRGGRAPRGRGRGSSRGSAAAALEREATTVGDVTLEEAEPETDAERRIVA